MTPFDIFSITTSVFSITLSLVSMWMGYRSVKDSENNYNKTQELLSSIKETSGRTDAIVGEHFSHLMSTILKIVESATTTQELRIAEAQMKEKEIEFSFQKNTQDTISKLLELGDTEKISVMLNAIERLAKMDNSK